jgi:hypothetical protein
MLMLIVSHLSCSQWEDTTFEGTSHKRQINVVFSNLVRLHYSSEVTQRDDTHSLATYWVNYGLSPDVTYGTAQGAAWSDF